MSNAAMPWYVRGVIGIGAWITALVLVALGGAIVFSLLDLNDPGAVAVVGIGYLALGISLLRKEQSGVFAQQLGIATSAAGAALVSGGLAAEAETFWVGCLVAGLLTVIVIALSKDKILQFLVAALTAGFYVGALIDHRTPYFIDLVALATPVGLYLLLRPTERDLMPTAVALLGVFPVVSLMLADSSSAWWARDLEQGGTFAQALHIVLFLTLVFLHWRNSTDSKVKLQVTAFAVVAALVCVLLPPGGSAAMLILMLAFVIGSRPFAVIGAALQAQFIARYYYSLDMNLFDKSLLLMAVGALLLAAWWVVQRADARGESR
ncbi:MAG: DUF4401 domain-containing protein [Gammaproteobacteria bacterium]|nr:DUF4401 domain-containing protein [Gammaproteobacteria bacterium]